MKPDYGTLTVTNRTPDGEVVREHQQDVESYVENFYNLASAVWGNQDVTGVTDTSGTSVDLEDGGTAGATWDLTAGSGITNHGIQIGDSGTSETITDTSLANQVTTNVSYGAVTVGGVATTAPDAEIDITRTFTNNTGSDLTVNEAGLVAQHTDTGSSAVQILMLRDTGSPITTVSDGNNSTFEYTLQVTN